MDLQRLQARLQHRLRATHAALQSDDLAIWIEQTFGLREDDEGRLARQSPTRLSDAAGQLASATGQPADNCEHALRDTLLAGSRARDDEGRALFAFKLHQFIGKGDTAYVTLEPPRRALRDDAIPAKRTRGPGRPATVPARVLP